MSPTLEDTLIFASRMHAGQRDKDGEPYILHVVRVMLRLQNPKERLVALLHDVVEDCGVTLNQLRELGYDHEVVQAVDALTKRAEEENDYMSFIRRVANSSVIAINVKIADLQDNTDPKRVQQKTAQTERRRQKYLAALTFLSSIN